MGIKFKFLKPISKEKFLHNLVNAKKRNSKYKHDLHKLVENENKATLQILDKSGKSIINCDFEFHEKDDVVYVECEAENYDNLQLLLVFDLLESINEQAIVRYIDSKFFFNGDVEFYFIQDGPRQEIHKVASDRVNLQEVTNSRTIVKVRQVLEEIQRVDFI